MTALFVTKKITFRVSSFAYFIHHAFTLNDLCFYDLRFVVKEVEFFFFRDYNSEASILQKIKYELGCHESSNDVTSPTVLTRPSTYEKEKCFYMVE